MKIKNIRIAGYKALRLFEVDDLPDFAVFAGPNGAGKSAVLEAIALLKEGIGAYSGLTLPAQSVNVSGDTAEISAGFSLSQAEVAAAQAREIDDASTDSVYQASVRIEGGNVRAVGRPAVLRTLFQLYQPREGLGVFEFFRANRRMLPRRVTQISLERVAPERFKQFRLTADDSKFAELKDQLAAIAFEDLHYFSETNERRDSLAQFKALFNRLFDPLEFAGVVPTRDGVEFNVVTPDGVHDIDLLSSGQLEVFMVFATLMQIDPKESVILYDEPELHLHGSVERRMAEELMRLADAPNQLLVASHSVELIGATPTTSLFHLERYAGQNQVSRVTDEQETLEVFESLGASVGLQLISPTVVFLEGEEAGGDKEVLGRLFPELSASVALVPSRSVTSVMEIAGRANDLLAQGTKFSSFYSIRDRDYLTADKRSELMRVYPRLIVLERHALENYLLDSHAIGLVMSDLGCQPGSEAAVEAALEQLADERKELEIANWVRYQLDLAVRGLLLKTGGSDALTVLKASADDLRGKVQSELAPDVIEQLANERRVFVDANWKACWRTEFSGKDLLRHFARAHAPQVAPMQFRNLIAAKQAATASPSKEALRTLLGVLF